MSEWLNVPVPKTGVLSGITSSTLVLCAKQWLVMNHNKNRLEKSSCFLLLKKTRHERLQIKKMVRKMWRSLYWSALFCDTLAIPSQSMIAPYESRSLRQDWNLWKFLKDQTLFGLFLLVYLFDLFFVCWYNFRCKVEVKNV